MKFPVFDLHCDTAFALLGERFDNAGSLKENQLHIDLERAKAFSSYAQCFACYTSPLQELPKNLSVIGLFERELASVLRETEKNSDLIRIAYCADEIRKNADKGIMSALLTIEGPAGFDYNTDLLDDLYAIGFRMTTLSWNEQNPLTGSCKTGGGLTEQGRDFVEKAQQLGMVIDVSHLSDEGFWDIINITKKPIVASHSNARALCDVPRNLTDKMYQAICNTDGTVGINLCADFLGNNPTVDTVCDHILHFLQLAGDDRHVSLGADFDGTDVLPAGFTGVQDYPKLAERLSQRGLSDNTIRNIFWNNALGVIDRCSM